MSPLLILFFLFAYFLVLVVLGWLTSRGADNEAFFLGRRNSNWMVVAFGMIGASLSGITFLSIPGWVEGSQFAYMQMVIGYAAGYVVIAYVLMPVYYRLNLTSIYAYLEQRFGTWSYRTGALFFLLSRITGASIRLLLVASVLQFCMFDRWGVPFEATVCFSILLIWLYTFRGGIKTIIWTDTLQTLFMLLSLAVSIWLLLGELPGHGGLADTVSSSGFSRIFFFDDFTKGNHFVKQFLGGMFIAIGMTGLDQDMMQKNLSCRNIREAQWNMMSFTGILMLVNFCFLALGALLFMFSHRHGIAVPVVDGASRTDLLFAQVALNGGLGTLMALLFLLGLIAAAYSSADSALTALTTSFCVDFMGIDGKEKAERERMRKRAHVGMSLVLVLVILVLNYTMTRNAIGTLIYYAGFTYGPLIGLFFFGLLTGRSLPDRRVPWVCIAAPVLTAVIQSPAGVRAIGYTFGPELILVNALMTYGGLWLISKSKDRREEGQDAARASFQAGP